MERRRAVKDIPQDVPDPLVPLGEASTDPRVPEQWEVMVRDIAARIRRARRVLGFSQDEIAKLAGVSQGAVSRVEAGKTLKVPLLTILKVMLALEKALAQLPAGSDRPELRQDVLSLPDGARLPMTIDPVVELLVQSYHDLPASRRAAFTRILQAVVDGFSGQALR